MASEDDAAFVEPDLSLPPQPLEDSLWERLLDQAFSMDESEIPSSLVPEFDEDTEELNLTDDSIDFLVLDDDSDTSIFEADDFSTFEAETDFSFDEPDFPLDFE